jgi:hypothetical protein
VDGHPLLSTRKGTCRPEGIRKLYLKDSQKKRRHAKRLAKKSASPDAWEGLKPNVFKHRLQAAMADAIQVSYSVASDMGATKPGWVAKRPEGLPKEPLNLDELCSDKYGLKVYPWDGK